MSNKKIEEWKEFTSVEEMIKDFEIKKANRTKFEIIKDYLYYDIYYPLENIFHPRWNYNRAKRSFQRFHRGWDDSDLWSLDVTIAKKFKDYFLWSCNSSHYVIVDCLNYVIDDTKFIDYEKKDYKTEFEKAELIYNKGINKFKEIFFTLDNAFVKDFVEFCIPRLIVFRSKVRAVPASFVIDDSDESFNIGLVKWKNELDLIIYSMELIRDMGTSIQKYDNKVQLGIDSFFNNFRNLWD